MPSRYNQPPTEWDERMAYPEPIAPNSIAPRPAINQQQGDLWAAIAAASAHLPEVKAAMRIIDKALSKPAPSLAPAPATNPPTASDKHLLHALHHGTLVEPHHHKRSASATAGWVSFCYHRRAFCYQNTRILPYYTRILPYSTGILPVFYTFSKTDRILQNTSRTGTPN